MKERGTELTEVSEYHSDELMRQDAAYCDFQIRLSYKGRTANALASGAEEGRDKLR